MRWCPSCRHVRSDSDVTCGDCGAGIDTLTETSFVGWRLADRYTVKRLIGKGGMGAVYEGEQLKLDRRVAIKILMPESTFDRDLVARFTREAQLIGKLKHPNIVDVIDYDVSAEGVPFMVMEYLEGESLRRVISSYDHGVPIEAFLIWMDEILRGVEAAHRLGVMHRDLKPENIMLVAYADGSRHVKILDFGLAKLLEGGAATVLTRTGELLGTPHYMSPEQIHGERTDARTDVYALGVIAFELLSGEAPFSGESVIQIVTKHLSEPPPDLQALRPAIPEHVTAAIARAMAKSPDDRWSTVREFRAALRDEPDIHDSDTIDIADLDPAQLAVLSASRASAARSRRQAEPRPADRSRRFGKVLAVAAIAAVLAAGAVLLAHLLLGPTEAETGSPDASTGDKGDAGAVPEALGSEPTTWISSHVGDAAGVSETLFAFGAADSAETLLVQPASLRRRSPTKPLSPPLPLPFTTSGQAHCAPGLWVIGEDRMRLARLDAKTLAIDRAVDLPDAALDAVCLDPGGRRWAYLARDRGEWVVFDSRSARAVERLPLDREYRAARPDPERRLVALASREDVSIRDLSTFEEVFHIPLSQPLLESTAVRWSPSGRFLAFGFKTLFVFDVSNKAAAGRLPTRGWISEIGWPADDAVTAADDRGTVYFAELPAKEWRSVRSADREGRYRGFWAAGENRWTIVDQRDRLEVLDFRSPGLVFELSTGPYPIWSIAPSAVSSIVAVSGKRQSVALVDCGNGKISGELEGHTDGVPFCRFTAGTTLLTASDDGTIRVWDTLERKSRQTITAHQSLINAFAVTAAGDHMVSVSSDRKVRAWTLPEYALEREILTTDSSGAMVSFATGSDERMLISDWAGNVYQLEGTAPDWTVRTRFALCDKEVYMLCAAPAGWWAVCTSGDKRGLWWIPAEDISAAEQVSNDAAGYCYSSADGTLTAVSFSERVEIRDNRTRGIPVTYRYGRADAFAVAIHEHDRLVLVGNELGQVLAWPLP